MIAADYMLGFATAFAPGVERDVLVGFGIALFLVGAGFGSWSFILASMVDLPLRHLLKNTVILFFAEWKASILVLGVTVLYWGIMLILSPLTFIWILLMGLSCYQLLVGAALIPAIKRRVTDPFENSETVLKSKE